MKKVAGMSNSVRENKYLIIEEDKYQICPYIFVAFLR